MDAGWVLPRDCAACSTLDARKTTRLEVLCCQEWLLLQEPLNWMSWFQTAATPRLWSWYTRGASAKNSQSSRSRLRCLRQRERMRTLNSRMCRSTHAAAYCSHWGCLYFGWTPWFKNKKYSLLLALMVGCGRVAFCVLVIINIIIYYLKIFINFIHKS